MKGAYVLNKLLEYSKLNGKSFSEKIGLIRPQAIYDIQNGKTQNISVSMANKIISAFPEVNKSWLFTGDGEMLIRPEDKITEKRGIPFYDINVTASIAESFNDIPEVSQYLISYPPLNDCCAAFPVYGESMEPDFFAGEVVLVKEITNVDSMLWGEPYLVITNANCDNLRTIKNVYLSEDRCKFILRATNPRFSGDTIIDRNDVLKIFLIKGKINRRQL
ncbi:S24 family peptidase [Candidatus Alistipes pullistercoris]|uniref:S24 family peptidase n=1 Tax=Candidatus Alistipes pullistercoris TaxID=2838446 RepID=UPI0022E14A18|nr:S24 family peptidase [Candidatus Alistipes pullistercoris]